MVTFSTKASSIGVAIAMMLSLFASHALLEKVNFRYCRSNVLYVLLYGNSTYCTMLSYSTRMIETFVFATINQILKGAV